MHTSNGIIVILSYPDTVVRPAYSEFSSKIWPLLGIGSKHGVQAGHAALLLVNKDSKEINYFDFGRYITSYGKGRVRSKETDPELRVPFTAEFKNDAFSNLPEILIWLDKHPEKTHGEGRLVVATNTDINYEKAKKFIDGLINQKEIPYGAFVKNGTNCARFVTDAIIASTTNTIAKFHLKKSNLLTPSPIGNVIRGNSNDKIFSVKNQKITTYTNRSVIREYKNSFFNKFDIVPNLKGTELPNKDVFNLNNATWLGGIGSGAWFKIEEQISVDTYKISRYTANGVKDFEGFFIIDNTTFQLDEKHEFIYPTNCKEMFVIQKELTFTLTINTKVNKEKSVKLLA